MLGLLSVPVKDLGLATVDVPHWELLGGLGQGAFSSVYTCRSTAAQGNNDMYVMKIFTGDASIALAHVERTVLNDLSLASVINVPTFKDFYCGRDFLALIVAPVGIPVLHCSRDISPRMLVALLDVVQTAHSIGWVHRDIKPANIFIDQNDTSRIILNDWSSAARLGKECSYVGTVLFGEKPYPNGRHTPEPRTDLCALVRTAHCLLRQRLPQVEGCTREAVDQYWVSIASCRPTIARALRLADNANYAGLKIMFENEI